MVRRPFVLLLALGGLALLFAIANWAAAPKSAYTQMWMRETSKRIGMFFERNGHLPPDLRALPERDGHENRTTDSWDRQLRYTVEGEADFTLSSLGRDDKFGGDGDDVDLVEQYRIVDGKVRVVEDGEVRPVP
jgi:hypothetical protein